MFKDFIIINVFYIIAYFMFFVLKTDLYMIFLYFYLLFLNFYYFEKKKGE